MTQKFDGIPSELRPLSCDLHHSHVHWMNFPARNLIAINEPDRPWVLRGVSREQGLGRSAENKKTLANSAHAQILPRDFFTVKGSSIPALHGPSGNATIYAAHILRDTGPRPDRCRCASVKCTPALVANSATDTPLSISHLCANVNDTGFGPRFIGISPGHLRRQVCNTVGDYLD